MSKDKKKNNPLKFFMKWSYGEPKHPKDRYGRTWNTGIEVLPSGTGAIYQIVFDENTSLDEWRQKEIDRWEGLMKNFKKDKKIYSLDYTKDPNCSYYTEDSKNRMKEEIEEIESDENFIKWID